MKIKEINRTANLAWSPKQHHPIYIAAGTAAQQLDATFSTSAALEIFHVDLSNKDFDMPVVGKLESNRRFNVLAWSDFEMSNNSKRNGLITGGTDNGEICVYNPTDILSGNPDDAIIHTLTDHTGPVQAIDLNPSQDNLFASGASNSEILIWDLKNPVKGLVPGPKTNPPDQITCIKWNKQVGHILAASSQSARVVVWDLRKSEPIIKVGDQSAMFNYKSIEWHPDVATQMLVGNEDDRYPVIQMWDLRFATSPLKVFEGHARGIMSLAWCPQDSDLLMSCAKDNRILCWNPNSQAPGGEIIYELPVTSQWTSDIKWCPRFPGIISTSSFDGHVTVSSIMGGAQQVNQQQQSQISDSFGIQQDAFNLSPQQTQEKTVIIEPLKIPPKWMRKPCGVNFAFGGKLVSFSDAKEAGVPKQVYISQVVTDMGFLSRSRELENCLTNGQLIEFCDQKISKETNEKEKLLWNFLKSNFHKEPRIQFLNLLGYNPKDLAQKISKVTSKESGQSHDGFNPEELSSKIEKIKTEDESLLNDSGRFDSGSNTPFDGSKAPPGSDNEGSALFEEIATQCAKDGTAQVMEEIKKAAEPFSISTKDDADGLVCQALLTGNFEGAVDVCFMENRMADGLLLAIAGGPDLFSRTQKRYLDQAKSSVVKVISAVVNRDWDTIVENAVIENWKEALCTLVTYSKTEEFSNLCCMLGQRLENEINDFNSALVCYICAGDVDKFAACWKKAIKGESQSPHYLQNLIEKIMVLKRSVENGGHTTADTSVSNMNEQLCEYANLLSSQGSLQTAMVYLSTVDDQNVTILKDRIYRAHGSLQCQPPEYPFNRSLMEQPSQRNYQMNKPLTSSYDCSPLYTPTKGPTKSPNNPYSSPADMYHKNQPPSLVPGTSMFNPGNSMPNSIYAHNTNMNPPPQPNQLDHHQPSHMMNGTSNMPNSVGPYNTPLSSSGYNPTPLYNVGFDSQPAPPFNQPTLFNPMQHQPPTPQPNMPTNAPPNMPPTAPTNIFNPAMSSGYNPGGYGQPPVTSMTQPGFQQQELTPVSPPVGPPPSEKGHPMSMKTLKKESPIQPSNQPEPLNFYNPLANQPIVPNNMPGIQQPPTAPNMMPIGNTVPPPGQSPMHKPKPKIEESPKINQMKGPIPAEHMILQQTYDALVERCKNASQSPQTKRKLEDVRRKLEILYDLLRENKVSQNVLNNLHQIVQVCQLSDYMSGLQIHTHMITTGNFSEISSFMPGLKTLMQIANQLRF